jgi:putative transposase
MPNTYSEVYYHVVWSTKGRAATLTETVERDLYPFIRHKCRELDAQVFALNGIEDHTHLAVFHPPNDRGFRVHPEDQGSSSFFINHHEPPPDPAFYWQEGFGVLTFAKKDLPRIVAYINGQKERHRLGKLSRVMEITSDPQSPSPGGSSSE